MNLERFNSNRHRLCNTELAVLCHLRIFNIGSVKLKYGVYKFNFTDGIDYVAILHNFKVMYGCSLKTHNGDELVVYDELSGIIRFYIPSMIDNMPLICIGSLIPGIVTKIVNMYKPTNITVDCSECHFENILDGECLFEGLGQGINTLKLVLPKGKNKLRLINGFHTFANTNISNLNDIINNKDILDLSEMEQASEMFRNIGNNKLDFTNIEFKQLTCVDYMFCDSKIQEVYFGENTFPCVEDATMMFCRCEALLSVKLNCFNGNRLKNYYGMFSGCTNLESIEADWCTMFKTVDADSMFKMCHSLKKIDIVGFIQALTKMIEPLFKLSSEMVTSTLKDLQNMFYECYKLEWCSEYTPMVLAGDRSLSLVEYFISLIDTDILNIAGIRCRGKKLEPINYAAYKIEGGKFPNILIIDEDQYNFEKDVYNIFIDRRGYSICFVEHEYVDITVGKLKLFGHMKDTHTVIVDRVKK